MDLKERRAEILDMKQNTIIDVKRDTQQFLFSDNECALSVATGHDAQPGHVKISLKNTNFLRG